MNAWIMCNAALVLLAVLWQGVLAVGATPEASSCTAASATCTAKLLLELSNSYTLYQNTTLIEESAQQAVDRFLVTCLGAKESGLRPLNILMVTQFNATSTSIVQRLAADYGWRAKVTVLSSTRLYQEITSNKLRNLSVYDLVVYSQKYLADMGRLQVFADLAPMVISDPRVNWADFTLYYRDAAAYDGQLVGLPVQGQTYSLYYRRDILAKYNISSPPHTWDDVVTLAERLNGTDLDGDGQSDWAVCHVLSSSCQAPHILLDIVTNILQAHGPTQGCLFDPVTMQPLVDNPGFAKSMEIYRRLAAVNPLYTSTFQTFAGGCNQGIDAFLAGKCLFTVQNSQVFKGSVTKRALWGKVGAAMVPGFAEVYDRTSERLVTCDSSLCPFAVKRKLVNGTEAWVNYAPWKGTVGYSGSVSASLSQEYRTAAFNYLAIGTSASFTWEAVLDNTSSNSPLRESMISGSDAYQRFVSAGYHPEDTAEWLAATKATLQTQNAVMVSGLPNPDTYQALYEDAALNITYRSPTAMPNTLSFLTSGWDSSIPAVQQRLKQGLLDLLAAGGPPALLQSYYWAAIGLRPPPSRDNGGGGNNNNNNNNNNTVVEGGGGSSETLSGPLLAAVIVPVVLVILPVLLVVFFFNQLQSARKRSLTGKVKPPGVSAETTLLITDVEGSTTLFEELDAHVMDQAMGMHATLIREVCLRHNGYEWGTEGDSFLLAFHSPRDAVLFATDIQVQLLQCNWPDALLAHALASTTWVASAQSSSSKPQAPRGPARTASTSAIEWRSLLFRLAARTSNSDVLDPRSSSNGAQQQADWTRHGPPTSGPLSMPANRVGPVSAFRVQQDVPSAQETVSTSHAPELMSTRYVSTPDNLVPVSSVSPSSQYHPDDSPLHVDDVNVSQLFTPFKNLNGREANSQPGEAANGSESQEQLTVGHELGFSTESHYRIPLATSSPPVATTRMKSKMVLHDSKLAEVVSEARGLQVQTSHLLSPSPLSGRTSGPGQIGGGSLPHGAHMVQVPQMSMSDSRGTSFLRVGSPDGASRGPPYKTLAEHLELSSPAAGQAGGMGHILLFRGLRVRIGLHSGVLSADATAYNPKAGRVQYSGPALQMTRAVQGAACGGISLMSESTVKLLPVESLHAHLLMGHEGEHLLEGMPQAQVSWHHKGVPHHNHEGQPVNLYSVIPRGLIYRAPRTAGRIRSLGCLTAGYLAAPFGSASICFMNVVGEGSLQKWAASDKDGSVNPQHTSLAEVLESVKAAGRACMLRPLHLPAPQSMSLYRSIACFSLTSMGGYLLESVDGMLLVAFPSPAQALRWALGVIADCLEADWPAELLEHELCEEVAIQGMGRDAPTTAHTSYVQTPAAPRQPLAPTVESIDAGPRPNMSRFLQTRMSHHEAEIPQAPQAGGTTARRHSVRHAPEARSLLSFPSLEKRDNSCQSKPNRTLLFRGLRIKAGIDFGAVTADLHATTGRVTYRGRCLNRASRIAGVAKTGQVWASEDAWNRAREVISEPSEGFGVVPLALNSLPLRSGYGTAAGAQDVARELALKCAHTSRAVTAVELEPQRLKGISEEVCMVSVALENADGMQVLAVKNTVVNALSRHASSALTHASNSQQGEHGDIESPRITARQDK